MGLNKLGSRKENTIETAQRKKTRKNLFCNSRKTPPHMVQKDYVWESSPCCSLIALLLKHRLVALIKQYKHYPRFASFSSEPCLSQVNPKCRISFFKISIR